MFGPQWETSVSNQGNSVQEFLVKQSKGTYQDFFADEETHGIIPRAISDTFKRIDAAS